jgi:hypothetical protein
VSKKSTEESSRSAGYGIEKNASPSDDARAGFVWTKIESINYMRRAAGILGQGRPASDYNAEQPVHEHPALIRRVN